VYPAVHQSTSANYGRCGAHLDLTVKSPTPRLAVQSESDRVRDDSGGDEQGWEGDSRGLLREGDGQLRRWSPKNLEMSLDNTALG
jgi:hypothetical protein